MVHQVKSPNNAIANIIRIQNLNQLIALLLGPEFENVGFVGRVVREKGLGNRIHRCGVKNDFGFIEGGDKPGGRKKDTQ